MKWKLAPLVDKERKITNELAGQLKAQIAKLYLRHQAAESELLRVQKLWRTLGNADESRQEEFTSLQKQILELSELTGKETVRFADEFAEITDSISKTRKHDYVLLLPLYERMHELCTRRLHEELPMREELASERELVIDRLRLLVEGCARESGSV